VRFVVTRRNVRIISPIYVRDPDALPREQGYINCSRLRTNRQAAEALLDYEITRLQAAAERVREISASLDLEAQFRASLTNVLESVSRIRRGRPAGAEDEIGEQRVYQ
jgi:hypothetical protein